MRDFFHRLAKTCSEAVGTPWAFAAALAIVAAWGLTGPTFGFSDTWQLFINTGTTIVTFLMVFLLQNAQNRDARALQLKLDELIQGLSGARNDLIDLEDATDAEIETLQREFARKRRREIGSGGKGGRAGKP